MGVTLSLPDAAHKSIQKTQTTACVFLYARYAQQS